MKAIKKFDDFIKERIVKVQKPDRSRAEFLVMEAEKSFAFLYEMIKKLPPDNMNANNYVKSCYDILMELIRARMLLEGYNASGKGAHEAEVAYLRKLKLKETDVQFADQMRFYRNGIMYYGTIMDKEYAEKVIAFTERMYSILRP